MASDQAGGLDYIDFELQIGAGQDGVYPVEVIRSPAGESQGSMQLPFGADALSAQLQALEAAILDAAGESTLRAFGQALFEALFSGAVQDRYVVSLPQALQARKGLRIKLRIQAPELAQLPWELIYDPGAEEFVALSRRTPIIRYLELPQPLAPLAVDLPLRVLGMTASPHDMPPLNVERERQRLEQSLKELSAAGLVRLEWLDGQTFRALQRALQPDSFHVFHFIGHGGFDEHAGEGLIALCDEDGNADRIRATDLSRLLGDLYALRMVVLSACEGARASTTNMFSSTATRLVRRGVPAAVAMQYAISDEAAIAFASAFYEALAGRQPIDAAMSYARTAMSRTGQEWGTPVLYTHAPDGVLFQPQSGPPAERPAPPVPAAAAPEPPAVPAAAAPEPPAAAAAHETLVRTVAEPEPTPPAPPEPAAQTTPTRPPITAANALDLQTLHTLEGHEKRINDVVFSPDSRLIASASGGDFISEERCIRFWRSADGALLDITIPNVSSIMCIAFSPDGTTLASGGLDYNLRLWRVADGRELPITIKHPDSVYDVAFRIDGQALVSACRDDVIRLWDARTGKPLRELHGHTADVNRIAISPDGQTIASASRDRTVCLWQVSDGARRSLTGHTDNVTSVAFSPDGQLLASGSWDCTVRLWRVADGELIRELKGTNDWVNDIAFTPDGQILAASHGQLFFGTHVVDLWQVATGAPLGMLNGHTKVIGAVAFSPDGRLIVSGSEDCTVRVWGIEEHPNA